MCIHIIFSQTEMQVQDSTSIKELDEIILSATRTERKLSLLPFPAMLINKKSIKSANSIRLSDILEEQTGLLMVPDYGGVEGVQIQGLDSQYSLVLLDGVPLIGRTAGTLDLDRITVGNIKQIEVVKGPSSSLYGSEALAGVINIVTEDPSPGFGGNVYLRSGSLSTNDISSELSFKNNKVGIYAFVNSFSSEGYDLTTNDDTRTVEPYRNYTINTKTQYNFSDNILMFFSGRLYKQDQDNRVSSSITGESEIDEWNIHSKFEIKFNSHISSQFEFYDTYYHAKEYLNYGSGDLFSSNSFKQRLTRPEIRTIFKFNSKNSIISGLGFQKESLQRSDFFGSPEFKSSYFYSQFEHKKGDSLNFILGARYDNHNEYSSQLSPKLAAFIKINDKIVLKPSISSGFKTPDFRQLYLYFTNSTLGYTVLGYNAVTSVIPEMEYSGEISSLFVDLNSFTNDLKAESSVGYNFGFNFKLNSKLKFDFNLFRNEIFNLIDTRIIAQKTNGQSVFSYYNLNEIYTQGIEINTNFVLNNRTSLSAGYQLLYAKDKAAQRSFRNGEVFARLTPTSPSFVLNERDYFGLFNRSRHMFNFNLSYSIPKWQFEGNVRGTYRSKFGLYDSNGNGYLDKYDDFVEGYSILDLSLNKIFQENFKISLGIDNFLDFKDYQNIGNVPGRIFYGLAQLNF